MGSRRAFTLVELMVVVLILGMIGGIAYASWQSLLPNQRMNTAVRNLSEVLYGTRAEAIARNRVFEIHYDIDHDSYAVRTPFLAEGGFATNDEDERLWVDRTQLAPEGLTIQQVTIDDRTYRNGEVYVRFDPMGASSYHTIVLHQALFDRTFTIEVLPLTGDIRFHDEFYERDEAEERDFQ